MFGHQATLVTWALLTYWIAYPLKILQHFWNSKLARTSTGGTYSFQRCNIGLKAVKIIYSVSVSSYWSHVSTKNALSNRTRIDSSKDGYREKFEHADCDKNCVTMWLSSRSRPRHWGRPLMRLSKCFCLSCLALNSFFLYPAINGALFS